MHTFSEFHVDTDLYLSIRFCSWETWELSCQKGKVVICWRFLIYTAVLKKRKIFLICSVRCNLPRISIFWRKGNFLLNALNRWVQIVSLFWSKCFSFPGEVTPKILMYINVNFNVNWYDFHNFILMESILCYHIDDFFFQVDTSTYHRHIPFLILMDIICRQWQFNLPHLITKFWYVFRMFWNINILIY